MALQTRLLFLLHGGRLFVAGSFGFAFRDLGGEVGFQLIHQFFLLLFFLVLVLLVSLLHVLVQVLHDLPGFAVYLRISYFCYFFAYHHLLFLLDSFLFIRFQQFLLLEEFLAVLNRLVIRAERVWLDLRLKGAVILFLGFLFYFLL